MALRILFLVNTLRTGGFERDILSYCQHIDRSRFDPEVWVLHEWGDLENRVKDQGVRVRSLNRGWSKSPLFAWRAARQIARSEADIVHAFLPAVGTYAALARALFRCRQPLVFSMGFTYMPWNHRPLFRLFSLCYDHVICNSPSVRVVAEDVGFNPGSITLIPNGHDLTLYERVIDRDAVRQRLGVGSAEKLLLYVGRLSETKRVSDAIESMALLTQTHPSAKLAIVGDGPERQRLEGQARELGLAERVIFAGQQADVTSFLMSADVFVFPSESEGLPNSVIEACLAGLPVVACDIPGVTDVVEDGRTAVLAPTRSPQRLAEAIRTFLDDPAAARRVAAEARHRAREAYRIEHVIALLEAFYESLTRTGAMFPSAGEQLVKPV